MIRTIYNRPIHTKKYIVEEHCTYLFSEVPFSIEILSPENTGVYVYTAYKAVTNVAPVKSGSDLVISNTNSKSIVANSHTVFIPKNNQSVLLRFVHSNGIEYEHEFKLVLTDDITKYNDSQSVEDDNFNEHYSALLTNYNLPNIDELEPAIIGDLSKQDLLRRLLLDFRYIVSRKGTKDAIVRLLNFVGFNQEQISVEREKKPVTINNQTEQIFTGDYFVSFNNWDDTNPNDNRQQLNSFNMPFRPISEFRFEDKLKYAIVLAQKYFTSVEQDITFFGVSFSSNIEKFKSISSSFNQILEINPHYYIKDLKLEIRTNNENRTTNNFFDTLIGTKSKQYRTNISRSQLAFEGFELGIDRGFTFSESESAWNVKRFVTEDDGVFTDEYGEVFGVPLRINFNSSNDFRRVEISINHKSIPFAYVQTIDTVKNSFEHYYILTEVGDYSISVVLIDDYNNKNEFVYNLVIEDNIENYELELFDTSFVAVGDGLKVVVGDELILDSINGIEIDSSSISLIDGLGLNHPIFSFDDVPNKLDTYYNQHPNVINRYSVYQENVSEYSRFFTLPSINPLLTINELTETLPVRFLDNFSDVMFIKYLPNIQLLLNIWDTDINEYKLIELPTETRVNSISDLERYGVYRDIHIQKIKVTEQLTDEISHYIVIIPRQSGIEFNRQTFELYINLNSEFLSVYDVETTRIHKQPINTSWNLFETVDGKILYDTKIDTDEINEVESLFNRLRKSTNKILSIGDVVLIKPNKEHIVQQYDVEWRIYDAFTGRLVMTSTDYMLKYRITYNSVFDVVYSVGINKTTRSKRIKIEKKSLFTSFKF